MSSPKTYGAFQVIELNQLDLKRFLPLSGLCSLSVHGTLYPLTLVRTRLQLQEGHKLYRGFLHCTRTIVVQEGLRGLYAGFWVKGLQVGSSVFYVGTYEGVRHHLGHRKLPSWIPRRLIGGGDTLSPLIRSFIAGGCASLVAQTMVVPIDVISQHLMVLASHGHGTQSARTRALTPLQLTEGELSSAWRRARSVVYQLKRDHGIRGFYKGYLISLCSFVPNSALWWSFYYTFCNLFSYWSPLDRESSGTPRLAVQLISAPTSGICSALIMNPVDVVRVRMQVENTRLRSALTRLLREEGFFFGKKGLTARFTQSFFFSFWIILYYEPLKRFCLKPEYCDQISW